MKKDLNMSDIEALKAFLMLPLESADAVFNKFADIPGAIRRGDGLEQFLFIYQEPEPIACCWLLMQIHFGMSCMVGMLVTNLGDLLKTME